MLAEKEVEAVSQWDKDTEKLTEGNIYYKRQIAKLWEVDLKTLYRWEQIALKYAAGYLHFHLRTRSIIKCAECKTVTQVDELQAKRSRRDDAKFTCPNCQHQFKPTVLIEEYRKAYQRLSYKQALILRLVGGLVSTIGSKGAIYALTKSQEPEHKKLRQTLRNLMENEANV